MSNCYYCGLKVPVKVQQTNRLCPGCGCDMHCCKNCIHFDETAATKCKEPDSPWIRDRAAENTCPHFVFRSLSEPSKISPKANEHLSEVEKAKAAFRALFRTHTET